jgi:hypothetical protein
MKKSLSERDICTKFITPAMNPRIKLESHRMIQDIQSELVRRDQGYPFVQNAKSQKIKEISTSPRTREKEKSVAEKRARYGT